MKKAKNNSASARGRKNTTTRNQGQRPGQQQPQRKVARAERAPVALGNKTYQNKPKFRSLGQNLIVSHSEYVGDIIGSVAPYNVALSVAINPGVSASFPWLNVIASRYESYKFMKLNYRFLTERPTTESGYVALVPDYDPTDSQPISKSTAFQYESTAKCSPWQDLIQVNTPANLSKRKTYFVRQGTNSSIDLELYDSGNLFICVGGNSGAVTLGELWCDYEVKFETPQIDTTFGLSDSAKVVNGTTPTGLLPFGTTSLPEIIFARSSIFSYDAPSGFFTFLIDYQGNIDFSIVGTVISSITQTGTSPTQLNNNIINAAATNAIYTFEVNALIGQTIKLAVVLSTLSSAILRVAQYQFSLL